MSNNQPWVMEMVPNERERRGAMVLRALPLLFIPALATAVTLLLLRGSVPVTPPEEARNPFFPLIPIVATIVFCTALIVLVRLGRPTLSALVLIAVWTLSTTMTSLQVGVTTFAPALLLIPICAAGLLLDGAASVSLAALATLLVASIAWMELNGLQFPPEAVPAFLIGRFPALAVGYWTGLFWTVAGLTWLLAGNLQRALRQSRAQAEALTHLSSQLEVRVAEQTAELARRAAQAEALHGISHALTRTLNLPELLGLISEQATRLLGFDAALVLLAQPDGPPFAVVETPTPPSPLLASLLAHEALLRETVERGQARLLPLPDDTRPHLALLLPLRYGKEVAGVLALVGARDGAAEPSAEERALAEGLADQAAVAIANAQLLARAHEAARSEERTRLAREIHDTLAQGLTGIVVQLGAAQRALQAAPEESAAHMDLAQRMARESLAEARRSVWNLRATALERGDLEDALRSLAAHPARGATVLFERGGTPWPLSPDAESALLRVAQEGLANAAKHAQATRVTLRLDYAPTEITLTVQDDGVGFSEEALTLPRTPSPWSGFGLLGMRERVVALGGTLRLANQGGAQVRATIKRQGIGGGEQQGEEK